MQISIGSTTGTRTEKNYWQSLVGVCIIMNQVLLCEKLGCLLSFDNESP
jgi:hypothetical protein